MKWTVSAIKKELELMGGEKNQELAKALQQLIDYKKIEEEFGVDLVTLFKALKDGIWSKGGYFGYCCLDNEPQFINPDEIELGIYWYEEKKHRSDSEFSLIDKEALCLYTHGCEDIEYAVRVKDYGKTWALTKEELE